MVVARLEPLGEDELDAWLRLMGTAGLGRRGIRRLLAALGTPVQVIAAGPRAWQGLVGAERSQALEESARPSPEATRRLDLTLAWLAGGPDRQLLTLGDTAYPAALLHSPDPPLLLYARGQIDRLQRPAIAIVGTRHPSPSGREITRAWAHTLSAAGLCIVSGMALGIDAAAHDGALAAAEDEGAGNPSALCGGTVAVVGTGLDQVYPRSHRTLADRIAAHGLLLSEYPLGTPPLAAHFPQRNRLIAGLSQGTLVVEAALQSGSLITARLALEASREVWAVPGPIHAPQSRGCHALIKQGASLVDDVQDLLVDLGLAQAVPPLAPPHDASSAAVAAGETQSTDRPSGRAGPPAARAGGDEAGEDPVLTALGWSPATLDVLHLRTGLSTSELVVRLLELELESRVERLPGELFLRIRHG